MSLFQTIKNLFRKEQNPIQTAEIKRLSKFESELYTLLEQDIFIARKDYNSIVTDYSDLYVTFSQLQTTGMLDHYCSSNRIHKGRIDQFLIDYSSLSSEEGSAIIDKHNDSFLNRHLKTEKDYLDNILTVVDPKIKLDDEQRKVVLSDEDYTLVIAGAGAGKTTTVSAKVKYLVEKKNIKPEEILVISYTNKAVGELQDKINKGLKINCPVTTFHKAGYAILRKQDSAPKRVVDQGFMYHVINNYLKGNILENPELVEKLILFFGSYFDAPYEGEDLNDFFNFIKKADFSTLKGNMDEYAEKIIDSRTGKCISIAHETLRSQQEVYIANYLYMNGIEYTYEKTYPYHIKGALKLYTPDFTIEQGDKVAYIEHFGISQDGKNSMYNEEQLTNYKKAINDKILLHKAHNTDLIYTFSSYNDGRPVLEHLEEKLKAHGFVMNKRSPQEIFEKIVNTEENKYISRLVNLICSFIQSFKTNNFEVEDFARFRNKTRNERSKLFLIIAEQCYHEYAKRLKEKQAIDFEDMINDSARLLREQQDLGNVLDFKYIIIDEYQDISRQRFNLAQELSKMCNAKIVAVGDDWQSIYAYAGSDITLFTNFKSTFGYGKELHITKTYRNAQEIIDIAGSFIQKNTAQIKKELISPKHIDKPLIIKTYTEEPDRSIYAGKGGRYYLMGQTVEGIMDEILEENPKSSILLLGRYGFDAYNLGKSADFVYDDKKGNLYSKKYENVDLDYMTVHRAKGLGYDNVIIINARDEIYGFPSKIQDDPVMKFVVKDDHTYSYAEERRLFYVALTRTKNRDYIIVPEQHPSEFVKELVEDYKTIDLQGKLSPVDDKSKNEDKVCPCCGYPLQLRYKKSYGLKLWICTNEPEVCGFMTNNLRGGDLSIIKCDRCVGGYLIVKEGSGAPFLGCTNYRPDKTGCDRILTKDQYYRAIRLTVQS